eukprot:GILJ01032241.1.p1 GENE.GILJ01032241.1~~GILJ01032241.1.p1  ORF type:complete len:152 (-),score=27.78 GILJ01032241.1:156-611(-)
MTREQERAVTADGVMEKFNDRRQEEWNKEQENDTLSRARTQKNCRIPTLLGTGVAPFDNRLVYTISPSPPPPFVFSKNNRQPVQLQQGHEAEDTSPFIAKSTQSENHNEPANVGPEQTESMPMTIPRGANQHGPVSNNGNTTIPPHHVENR